MTRNWRPGRAAVCAAAVLALALPLAACGGDDDDPTGGADSSAQADNAQNAAQTKMLACLKDQGIDVGGAQSDDAPTDAEREKIMAALNGPCKEYRTALGTGDPQKQEEFRDQATKFASCLKGKGVDLPPGDVVDALRELDRDDPKTSRAIDDCGGLQSLRAGGAG